MQFCRILFAFLVVLVLQACSSSDDRNTGSLFIPDVQPESKVSPNGRGGASPVVSKRHYESVGGRASAEGKQLIPVVEGLPPDLDNEGEILYQIGPYDLLKITVFNVEELSSEERVSEDGKIVLPLVGSIAVAGLTPEEAEQEVAKVLGQTYLKEPQVDIFVSEYASLDVTVTGAVKRPGVYPITGRTTLLQAIASAEGLDELADDNKVILFRGQGTPDAKAYVVDFEGIQEGKLRDPVLVGDDSIIVSESGSLSLIEGIADTLRGFIYLRPVGGYPGDD